MLMTVLLFLIALSTPAAGQQPSEEELAMYFRRKVIRLRNCQ